MNTPVWNSLSPLDVGCGGSQRNGSFKTSADQISLVPRRGRWVFLISLVDFSDDELVNVPMPGCWPPIPSRGRQRIGAVSYRKRSIETQTAVVYSDCRAFPDEMTGVDDRGSGSEAGEGSLTSLT